MFLRENKNEILKYLSGRTFEKVAAKYATSLKHFFHCSIASPTTY